MCKSHDVTTREFYGIVLTIFFTIYFKMRHEYRSVSFLNAVSKRKEDTIPEKHTYFEDVFSFVLNCEGSFESFSQNCKELISLYSIKKFKPLVQNCIEKHLNSILLTVKSNLEQKTTQNKKIISGAVFKKVKNITGEKPTGLSALIWESGSYFKFPKTSIVLSLNTNLYKRTLLDNTEPTKSEWADFVTKFLQEFENNNNLSFQLLRDSGPGPEREYSNHTLNLFDLFLIFSIFCI